MVAIAKHLVEENATCESQVTAYGKSCCVLAYAYLKIFDGNLKCIVHAFKAVRYLSPSKVSKLKLTTADISSLAALPFLKSKLIGGLKSELSEYLAEAEDVSGKVDVFKR